MAEVLVLVKAAEGKVAKTTLEALTLARLALVQAVAFVIASGLRIFGVEPVEEMR